jgi:hypothetical protein
MMDLLGNFGPAPAAAAPAVDVAATAPNPDLGALLRLFLDQSRPVTSVVAIGCRPFRPENGGRGDRAASLDDRDGAMLFRLAGGCG